ncbi:MAG: XRE family transcriptional regulator, partial [Clostridia bacterium]|nr:XRE family transcriptional regulator [Clostridia bacterium]
MKIPNCRRKKMNKFGEFLYQLRKEKGMTQSELADKLDITNKAVSKWETGESYPETAQLLPISRIFSITIDELLNGERSVDKPYMETKPKVEIRPLSVKEGVVIALGVSLLIIGVILLIVLGTVIKNEYATAISVTSLLIPAAIAVALFMVMGLNRRMSSVELPQEEAAKGRKSIALLSVGVAMLILSPILLIFINEMTDSVLGVVALLGMVAFAMLLIIPGGISWGNFIKAHNIPEDEDESKMTESAKRVSDALCGCIMLLAVAAFLVLGLVYA